MENVVVFQKLKRLFHNVPFLFFVLAGLIQYREIIFFSKKIGWDTLDALFPQFLFVVDSFKSSTLPFYNPYTLGGFSFSQNFFSVFLLNPLDIALAIFAIKISPLYVFHMQFPIFGILSGYWFYNFLKRNNQDFFLSILGGITYSSGILFPLVGQASFFYSFVLFAFLVGPFFDLINSRKFFQSFVGVLFLATLLLKAYFFFIPFLMIGAFFLLVKEDKTLLKIATLAMGAGALIYLLITYPVLVNLKSSTADLNGSFASPEPRLRSLVPEKIYFYSSIRNVLGDIVDSRLVDGSAWTKGFNLSIFFLFLYQFFIFLKDTDRKKEKGIILFILLFSMFVARGSFNSLHKAMPFIGSFRWAFSYVHFSQICYLLMIFYFPLRFEKLSLKDKKIISGIFLLFFTWIFIQAADKSAVLAALPICLILILNHTREKYILQFCLLVTSIYLFLPIESNRFDGKTEYEKVKSRKLDLLITSNARDVGEAGEYKFEDRGWIYDKKPTLNGYNNSIHPIFWYLKSHHEASEFFVSLCGDTTKLYKKRSDYSKNDNQYLIELSDDLITTIKESRCQESISDLNFGIDQVSFISSGKEVLLLQDMTGFNLQNQNLVEKRLIGGMRLVKSEPNEKLVFNFEKKHFIKSSIFICATFISSIFLLLMNINRRKYN